MRVLWSCPRAENSAKHNRNTGAGGRIADDVAKCENWCRKQNLINRGEVMCLDAF